MPMSDRPVSPEDIVHCTGAGKVVHGPPVATAPKWAHLLLDAYLFGEPLNFGGERPPLDIQDRLDRAVADGTMGTVGTGNV